MFRPLLLSALILLTGVACAEEQGPSEAVGTLRVISHTTGANPDPDHYTLTVTTQGSHAFSSNDTLVFAGLPIDDYGVTIGDVEGSCIVADGVARTPYVSMGTTTVQFFVTCN
jgi:hypothetical protein